MEEQLQYMKYVYFNKQVTSMSIKGCIKKTNREDQINKIHVINPKQAGQGVERDF